MVKGQFKGRIHVGIIFLCVVYSKAFVKEGLGNDCIVYVHLVAIFNVASLQRNGLIDSQMSVQRQDTCWNSICMCSIFKVICQRGIGL